MKSFYYNKLVMHRYTHYLNTERRNLVDMFGFHNFYNCAARLVRFDELAFPEVRNKLTMALKGHATDFISVLYITLHETDDWQLFELACDMDGGNMGIYEERQIVTVIKDDAQAVMYKLRYK
jgi:hypothetical protein